MRSRVLVVHVEDFHMGLESYQKRVNLSKPLLSSPWIQRVKSQTCVEKPMFGIANVTDMKHKLFMAMSELENFCIETLLRVKEKVKKMQRDYYYRLLKLSDDEETDLKIVDLLIIERLDLRESQKHTERYIGAQKYVRDHPNRRRPT